MNQFGSDFITVVEAETKMKKMIKSESQTDKAIKRRLKVDFLLWLKTAKVKKLPKSPKIPTMIKETPSIQNLADSYNG